MKRSPLKRKSRTEEAKLKDKLWELCKQITRKRYARPDGSWTCYTCKKHIVTSSDAHTGHFIPSSVCGAYLRYDLRNLRVQCLSCNVHRGGMGADYYRQMVADEGQEYVDALYRDKNITIKADKHWYLEKIAQYATLYIQMQK